MPKIDKVLARGGLCRTKNVINASVALRQDIGRSAASDKRWVAFIRQAQGKG